MKILTKKQMINAEQNSVLYGVSLSCLMQNAGFALFDVIKKYAYENMIHECLLIVGSGKHGGDGKENRQDDLQGSCPFQQYQHRNHE